LPGGFLHHGQEGIGPDTGIVDQDVDLCPVPYNGFNGKVGVLPAGDIKLQKVPPAVVLLYFIKGFLGRLPMGQKIDIDKSSLLCQGQGNGPADSFSRPCDQRNLV
jgi:hypothetical protein